MAASVHSAVGRRLVSRVRCPHCWQACPPEELLWISQHPELLGDGRLGADHQQRFLPTRFTVDGDAIDARGFTCTGLACPNCHLALPRALVEMEPVFMSILGTPASGKSYFLTSMTWMLRKTLPTYFGLSFNDADPMSNRSLNEYEELQFLNPHPERLVAIRKTELQGELYDTVLFNEQAVSFPRPFLFSLTPRENHPNFKAEQLAGRVLCLYDNAGEHFLPGQDTAISPVTRHLALSRVLFFLFDPTQDPRFRAACQGKTSDPQMHDRARTTRQESVLLEAAERVRRYCGLRAQVKHQRPLVMLVTKFDAWSSLLDSAPLSTAWVKIANRPVCSINAGLVEQWSQRVRQLLWQFAPEMVAAAEGFAEEVVFIPVSATGRGPEIDPETNLLGLRPQDIRPLWADVPLVYAISRWMPGLIGQIRPEGRAAKSSTASDPGRAGPASAS